MSKKVRWGIMGLGGIAHRVMKGITAAKDTVVVAAASRDIRKADSFAKEYGIAQSHGSYEGLLLDKNVDLVYIALPNHLHKEWTIKAAQAGKNVLCEKPLAMDVNEAREMVAAARKYKVFLMEAFMYRCHPQIKILKKLLASKVVGEVRIIQGSFSYAGLNPENCRYINNEGGGGLMDVGCYPVSLIRLIAGEEPVRCEATGTFGKETQVDHWAAGVMKFPSGIIAHFQCGMEVNTEMPLTIYGTLGRIRIPHPWVPGEQQAVIEVTNYKDWKTKTIPVPAKHIFANEAEAVVRGLSSKQAPEMDWNDSLRNMAALDKLRASMGLK